MSLEPTVVAIDTAGPLVGAAVSVGGETRTWSERVVRGADAVLGEALALMMSDVQSVELVVVSVGPGAFTSLRVGVATALGLAMAQECPVLGLSSLEARAQMLEGDGRVLALLDARKSRAYGGAFQWTKEGLKPMGEEQDLVPEEAVLLAGSDGFRAVGEGAVVWRELVVAAGGRVVSDPERSPVGWMASNAWSRRSQSVSPGEIRLRYLRDPDARKPSRPSTGSFPQ